MQVYKNQIKRDMKSIFDKMTQKQLIKLLGIHSTLISFKSNENTVIPEAIRLMGFQELIANLNNNKSETQLIKQILIHLLKGLQIKEFSFKETCLPLLTRNLLPYRSEIIDKYYLQIIYEIYENTLQQQADQDKFFKQKEFYEQNFTTKLNILNFLIKRQIINDKFENQKKQIPFLANMLRSRKSVNQNKKQKTIQGQKIVDDEIEQVQNQFKNIQIKDKTTILLGEDGQNYYIYCNSLPQYVLKFQLTEIKKYNKSQTVTLIKELLSQPRQLNKLALIKKIIYVNKNYQLDQSPKIKIRITEAKNKISYKQKIEWMKVKFQQFMNEYDNYLQIHNKCFAPKYFRLQLISQLRQCNNQVQLTKLLEKFYIKTKAHLFKCQKVQNQLPNDVQEQKQYYTKLSVKNIYLYANQFQFFSKGHKRQFQIHKLFQLVLTKNKLTWIQILFISLKQSLDLLLIQQKQRIENINKNKIKRLVKQSSIDQDQIIYKKKKGPIALESNSQINLKKYIFQDQKSNS